MPSRRRRATTGASMLLSIESRDMVKSTSSRAPPCSLAQPLDERDHELLLSLLPRVVVHLRRELRKSRGESTALIERLNPDQRLIVCQARNSLVGAAGISSKAIDGLLSAVDASTWAALLKWTLASDPKGPLIPLSVTSSLLQNVEGGFGTPFRIQHSSNVAKVRLMAPLLQTLDDLRRSTIFEICATLREASPEARAVFQPLLFLPTELEGGDRGGGKGKRTKKKTRLGTKKKAAVVQTERALVRKIQDDPTMIGAAFEFMVQQCRAVFGESGGSPTSVRRRSM